MILKRLLRILFITVVLVIALACQKATTEPDPPSDSLQWQRIADFGGTAVVEAARFVIGNQAFVGTGVRGWNTAQTEFEVVADFWSYDSAANSWNRIADYGGGAVAAASGFSINNQGYVGLGHGFHFDARRDFWSYDPAGNSWTRKADFPGALRYRGVGVAAGDKGYIIGGMSIDNGINTARRDTWEYDPRTDTWTRKADFPGEARWGAAGFAIGTKVYVGLEKVRWRLLQVSGSTTPKPTPGPVKTISPGACVSGRAPNRWPAAPIFVSVMPPRATKISGKSGPMPRQRIAGPRRRLFPPRPMVAMQPWLSFSIIAFM